MATNSTTKKSWFAKRLMNKEAWNSTTATNSTTKKSWFVRKLMNKEAWRWRLLSNGGILKIKWKRINMIKLSVFHDIYFKIISTFEAVFLVSTLCLFFLCCGCHF
ncbi:hypothetical protein RND81_07G161800 [Saponaria officinalis]|uniref:Transmembrane protein n=1 Tax=Saponaria officinalis TaxID=3572 RepID=A0AAW1JUE4_SAPOF